MAAKGAFNASTAQNLLKPFGGLDPLSSYGARATSIGSFSGLRTLAGTSALAMPLVAPPCSRTLNKSNFQGLNHPWNPQHSSWKTHFIGRSFDSIQKHLESSRGPSIESQSSALLNNAFEDMMFSMLVARENKAALNAQLNLDPMNPTPMADTILRQAMAKNSAALANGAAAAPGPTASI
mmetsp:Transcript_12638/g.30184  ORF Transcript_12638/g.30184 Transcript_12638/m.30184 type:complete len:180 (-) Transcript_12638:10-549(-)